MPQKRFLPQNIDPLFYRRFWSHCKGGEVTISIMKLRPSCLVSLCLSVFGMPALAAGAPPTPGEQDSISTGGYFSANSTAAGASQRMISVRPTSIAVLAAPDGRKTLNIHFLWSLITDPSVEVRLVPEAEAKGPGLSRPAPFPAVEGKIAVAPIYFHDQLKGRVREELYHCLDQADHGGKTYSFTKDKIVYNMIGSRNSLGRQGVHVKVSNETPTKSDMPAAVFLQLDTWAVDKDTLSLELARDQFAEPGTLFVWFFRGDKVLWEEQIRWPGYK
jgi:hypothetical protein